MGIYAETNYVNVTEGGRWGDSDISETSADTPGELYRSCVQEYGRCTSKVYVDGPDGPRAVGWVFLKRDRYEDTHQPFLRETWVTCHEAPPTVTREFHYLTIGGKP